MLSFCHPSMHQLAVYTHPPVPAGLTHLPDPLGGTDLLSCQSAAKKGEQQAWPPDLAHFDDIKDLLCAGPLPGLVF